MRVFQTDELADVTSVSAASPLLQTGESKTGQPLLGVVTNVGSMATDVRVERRRSDGGGYQYLPMIERRVAPVLTAPLGRAAPIRRPVVSRPHDEDELWRHALDGRLLWQLRFGGSLLAAYLCDVRHWGVAYRLYLNGRFTYSERFASAEMARRAATELFELRVADGWQEQRGRQHG